MNCHRCGIRIYREGTWHDGTPVFMGEDGTVLCPETLIPGESIHPYTNERHSDVPTCTHGRTDVEICREGGHDV